MPQYPPLTSGEDVRLTPWFQAGIGRGLWNTLERLMDGEPLDRYNVEWIMELREDDIPRLPERFRKWLKGEGGNVSVVLALADGFLQAPRRSCIIGGVTIPAVSRLG